MSIINRRNQPNEYPFFSEFTITQFYLKNRVPFSFILEKILPFIYKVWDIFHVNNKGSKFKEFTLKIITGVEYNIKNNIIAKSLK